VSKPDNSQVLRFIYRGRFLGDAVTPSGIANSLPNYVLHLCLLITCKCNLHSNTHVFHVYVNVIDVCTVSWCDLYTVLSIPTGKTTVLHMVIRETLPDNPQSGTCRSIYM